MSTNRIVISGLPGPIIRLLFLQQLLCQVVKIATQSLRKTKRRINNEHRRTKLALVEFSIKGEIDLELEFEELTH